MENVYKIKMRTNLNPHLSYPSERRYSASIVLGLGVVHLALASTALLLACLTLTANEALHGEVSYCHNHTMNEPSNNSLGDGVTKDLTDGGEPPSENQTAETGYLDVENIKTSTSSSGTIIEEINFNWCRTLTFAPCIMCLGSVGAGLSALLAWKRWYIDHNIKWFFIMSLLSTITSSVCLILIGILLFIANEKTTNYFNISSKYSKPSVKYVIIINILIAGMLEWLWSMLSSKIGFVGMRNEYPDDIVISKSRGKLKVNIKHKGNKKRRLAPPDIINHFPISGKITKHLPKKNCGNLPKEESHSEYQERVNKFLTSNVDANSAA